MQSKVIGAVILMMGFLVAIDGFVRMNSLSSQFWHWFGFTDTTAYLEIGFGAVGAITGVVLLFYQSGVARAANHHND